MSLALEGLRRSSHHASQTVEDRASHARSFLVETGGS
jgi:hypothetical protein